MAQIPEQLSLWQKAAIDASIAYAQTALTSAEQLLRLNLEAARTALEQQAQAARDLLTTNDPQELAQLRTRLAQNSMEKTASYAQGVYELVSQTQAQLAGLAEQQFARVNEQFLKYAAPGSTAPGSEVTAAAVQSSLAASAAMMENLNRATKQFADLSEATIRAAASNMVRTVTKGQQTQPPAV